MCENSMIVAKREGPAIKGTASGNMKGSPGGIFALMLSEDGKRTLMAVKNKITPEANRNVGSERVR